MNTQFNTSPLITAEQVYAHRVKEGTRLFAPEGASIPFSPDEQTLLHRWQRIVDLYGERPAVEEGDRILTYAEVNVLANRIAHAILARRAASNVASDVPVGLLFDVEADMPISMLAAWKAGTFFTWFEPRQPLNRSQFIVEESGTSIVVTNRTHEALARQLWPDTEAVIVIEDLPVELSTEDPPLLIDAIQPAYLMYTSGSTGTPKGTVDLHGNLVELLVAREKLLHFGPHERSAFLLFGVGIIFGTAVAWMYGGCVLPFRLKEEGLSRFSQWLIERRVTFVLGGADVRTWLLSLDGSQQFPDLRMLVLATSPSYREHWLAYRRHLPDHCLLINLYSATEFRSGTLYLIDKSTEIESRLVPVGYAVSPTTIEIWNEDGQPQPIGETGEVVILSPHVAQGYWKSPELNAVKFGVDSLGRRYYRTGDLGRLDAQHCLWVLGRKDGQVKIRGNRVESAEIEVALLELPGVREAAVIYVGDTDDERMLLGFVTVKTPVTGDELRKQLDSRLPDYMIPARVIVLEELPRNANGKVARPLLRDMAMAFSKLAPEKRSTTPQFTTDTQRRVAGIVSALLEGVELGPDDNFFDSGGHSLLAARLMLEIERVFGVELPPRDFFAEPTISALAARADAALAQKRAMAPAINNAVPAKDSSRSTKSRGIEAVQVLSGSSALPPFFFCPGWNGSQSMLMRYQVLFQRMRKEWSLYGLVANGCSDPNDLFATMDDLIDAAMLALRQVQPKGPYVLWGECIGGKLAYELARRLEKAGEEVSLLILLDSPIYPSNVKLKRKARVWRKQIQYHSRQLSTRGWRDRVGYVMARLAALLPHTEHKNTSYRPLYLAHQRYLALLTSYQPTEHFAHPVKAIFTTNYQHNLKGWRALLSNLDANVVKGKHKNYLVAAGDEVVTLLRPAIDEALSRRGDSRNGIPPSDTLSLG
jgi:acyl-coenzyme A synthetase/AMP-(fatty) acid ligase/thioesterase domain-containing protein/acyl carrier protein